MRLTGLYLKPRVDIVRPVAYLMFLRCGHGGLIRHFLGKIMNLRFHAIALAALLISFAVDAQNPAPLDTPNLQLHHAGYIYASTVLADGSVVVGGKFNSFDGVPHMRIAKFNSNGTLDSTWTPQVGNLADRSFSISAITADSAGNVYFGGSFAFVNGTGRANIAKLLPDGSLDTTWNPVGGGASYSEIKALALDGNGSLFVGGSFTAIGGQTRSNLAKLSATGAGLADATWNPSPNNVVAALAIDGSGNLYVGGNFTSIGSRSRTAIAKLSTSGSGAADADWNPAPTGSAVNVRSVVLDGSGSAYVAGAFTSIGGQSRNGIAKLTTAGTGTADATWNPSPSGAYTSIKSLALDGSGNIYVGGYFTGIGGHGLLNIARLSTGGAGASDSTWNPGTDYGVESLAIANATVYAGGTFTSVGGVRHLAFARIDPSGVVDSSAPDAEVPGQVLAIAQTPDAGVIVGGFFLKANGQTRRNILRVQPDGSLDPTWDAPADQLVLALAQDGAGNVYVGGIFDHIGGQARAKLAKLSATGSGSVDANWRPDPDATIAALTTDGNGNIYVGGNFANIAGQTCAGLARLSTAGIGAFDSSWSGSCAQDYPGALTLDGVGHLYAGGYYLERIDINGNGDRDPSWSPPFPDQIVSALGLDGNGHIYVGGRFANLGAVARNHIAKLSTATGALDATWNPGADGRVSALAIDTNGNIYAGGGFLNIGGQARNAVARLSGNGAGGIDPAWNPSADAPVYAITQASNGNIYVGGSFVDIGAQSRGGLALFAGDAIFLDGFEDL